MSFFAGSDCEGARKPALYGLGGVMKKLLAETATRAAGYLAGIGSRRVAPRVEDIARLDALGGVLPQPGSDPVEVLALLDDVDSPAPVTKSGGTSIWLFVDGSSTSSMPLQA